MSVAESWLLWHFFTAQRSAVNQTLWAALWHLLICCSVNVEVLSGGAPSCVCLVIEALTANSDFYLPELTFLCISLCSKCLLNICIDVFVCCCFSSTAGAFREKAPDLPLHIFFSSLCKYVKKSTITFTFICVEDQCCCRPNWCTNEVL